MELLGVVLALAVAGGGGYAVGRGQTQRREALVQAGLDGLTRRFDALEMEHRHLEQQQQRCERTVKGLEVQQTLHGSALKELEKQLKEQSSHTTALAQETLALGSELKGSLAALESEADARLNALAERQGEVLAALEQQLSAMQTYIVNAAEEAKARREAVATMPAAPLEAPAGVAELLEQQRQAQAVFAARRRAAAEASFPGPGAGL